MTRKPEAGGKRRQFSKASPWTGIVHQSLFTNARIRDRNCAEPHVEGSGPFSYLTMGAPGVHDRTATNPPMMHSTHLGKGVNAVKEAWPKAFTPETIASIQAIQDSLASLSSLYIAVLDTIGAPLTIPSNQSANCSECQTRYPEIPCLPNFKQAIAETVDTRRTTIAQCPFGLSTYFSPLGTSGNPSRSNLSAILSIGKRRTTDRFPPDDHPLEDDANHSPAGLALGNVGKTVTTYCRIFDLIFSLAQHTASHAAGSLNPGTSSTNVLSLTVRELEVLKLVSLGLSNRTIADRLFISETTAKTHIHNISRKVKINNRTSLALFFLQSM